MPPDRRALRLLATALPLAFALACTSGGDDDTADNSVVLPMVYPTISAPEPLFQRVAPGETAAVEWTVTWPDGERPRHVAFTIGAASPPLDSTVSEVRGGWVDGRSVYRMELTTPSRGAYVLPLDPYVCVTTVCEPVPYVGGEVQVAGGPADAVFPPLAATTLAIGEVRPMTAFAATAWGPYAANPNGNFGERFWSDDALTFSTDDPAVASVDGDGVLTGVAAGSTTLRIGAGEAEATVAIDVLDAPLGPPSGEHLVAEHQAVLYRNGSPNGGGPVEGKVAVDPEGWPMIVAPLSPGFGARVDPPFITQQPPLALARWTGTGFGWEWLGEPSERNWHGVVETDDDGHVWVVLRDRLNNEIELWDRPGDVVIGGWRKRRLPIGVERDGIEADATWFSEGINNEGYEEHFPVVTLRRPEGGLYVAYASWQRVSEEHEGYVRSCPRMLRLATVSGDTLDVEPVEQRWMADGQDTCGDVFGWLFGGGNYVRLALLPSDGPRPTIVALQRATGFGGPGNLWTWSHDGSAWGVEVSRLPDPVTDEVADDLAPILPVESPDDWLGIDDIDAPLWAWRDSLGEVRHDDPLSRGLPGDLYGGHGVDDASIYVFVDQYPDMYDRALWLHASPR